jgi:SPP1 gp7 family putative phage head morphogenesis protein
MAPKPRPKLNLYPEATRWFRKRVPIVKEEWLELDRRARLKAFTVAHVAQMDVINDTLKALTKAIEQGQTLQQFKQKIGAQLEAAWGEKRAWHLQVIFRNNVQMAYAHGREIEMRKQSSLRERPYWMFSAILDTATTEICRPLHGKVFPAEHPFWTKHTPPLHHQCRSIKRALTPEQAKARGISRKPPASAEPPQEGFGGADPLAWKPDLGKYPRELQREFKRKEKAALETKPTKKRRR